MLHGMKLKLIWSALKKKILAYMEHDRMEVKELLKDPELK